MAGDTYFSNVALLLHCDVSFVDASPSPKTVTASGNAQLSSVQSKFGGSSALFDGNGDYLGTTSADFSFAGDFTIEGWVYCTDLTKGTIASSRLANINSNLYWILYINADGSVGLQTRNTTQYFALTAAGTVVANQWYHIAATRTSGVIRIFVNGVVGATTANDGNFTTPETTIAIGLFNYPGYVSYFAGYVDEFRVTKGISRYTTSFTPPTEAFPNISVRITGSVTVAGDPDDWIVTAFDADTHAFAGVAAVSGGTYEVTGLTAGKAYVVACRPKSGGSWSNARAYAANDLVIPSNVTATPYLFKTGAGASDDANWSSVVVLCPFNGANGSTTFIDLRGHPMTAVGNAKISTAQDKAGGSSGYFDGAGDGVYFGQTTDLDFSTGNFTIELFLYVIAHTNYDAAIVSSGGTAWATGGRIFRFDSGAKLSMYGYEGGFVVGATAFPTGAWKHVALVKNGSTIKIYLDGTEDGSFTSTSANNFNNGNKTYVGYSDIDDKSLNGYIDGLRITKGVARYTSSFTPPTYPYPGVTAATEPNWPTTVGATVVDGGITWTNMGRFVRPLMHGPVIAL